MLQSDCDRRNVPEEESSITSGENGPYPGWGQNTFEDELQFSDDSNDPNGGPTKHLVVNGSQEFDKWLDVILEPGADTPTNDADAKHSKALP